MELSVLVPNYNHGRFLSDTLEAILTQSRPPDEVIVADDASTDDSVEIVSRVAERDPRVRLLRNPRNLGTVANANILLAEARGEFVYFAGADDRILPTFLDRSLALLQAHPRAAFCVTDPVWYHQDSDRAVVERLRFAPAAGFVDPRRFEALSREGVSLPHHTSVMRRRPLLDLGGFPPQLRWYTDWFVLHVLAFRHGFCYLPEPLAVYRRVPHSYAASAGGQAQARRDVLTMMVRLLESPEYSDVAGPFVRTNALALFGLPALRAMRPVAPVSLRFLGRALGREWRNVAGRMAPGVVREAIARFRLTGPAGGRVVRSRSTSMYHLR